MVLFEPLILGRMSEICSILFFDRGDVMWNEGNCCMVIGDVWDKKIVTRLTREIFLVKSKVPMKVYAKERF